MQNNNYTCSRSFAESREEKLITQKQTTSKQLKSTRQDLSSFSWKRLTVNSPIVKPREHKHANLKKSFWSISLKKDMRLTIDRKSIIMKINVTTTLFAYFKPETLTYWKQHQLPKYNKLINIQNSIKSVLIWNKSKQTHQQ